MGLFFFITKVIKGKRRRSSDRGGNDGGIPAPFLHWNHMKFQILCKDLGFEEIPGTNTWALDGSSVSAVGGGQKRWP